MVVTRQRYRSFETIVDDLSKAIPLPYGVRNVFSPGGSVITTINQLEDGRHYVCSSGDQLIKNVSYGEKMKDKPRSLDVESFSGGSSHSSSSRDSKFGGNSDRNPKPRVITIVSERDRNKKCKILLNTKTVKSFDAVLKDISDMLKYSVKELRNLEGIKVRLKLIFVQSASFADFLRKQNHHCCVKDRLTVKSYSFSFRFNGTLERF